MTRLPTFVLFLLPLLAAAASPSPALPREAASALAEFAKGGDPLAIGRAVAAVERTTAPDMDGAISLRVRLLEALAPHFRASWDLSRPPRLPFRAEPPPGFDSGVAPESAEDPGERAAYERRIAELRASSAAQSVQRRIRAEIDVVAELCSYLPGDPADTLARHLKGRSVPPGMASLALRGALSRRPASVSGVASPELRSLLGALSRHAVSSFRPALPAFREPAERARAELSGGTEPSAVLRELFDALAAVRAPKGGRALAAYARDKARFLVASDPPLRLAAPEAFAAECAAVRAELSERLSLLPKENGTDNGLCEALENAHYALGAETGPTIGAGSRERNETTNKTGDKSHGRNIDESF